MYVQHLWEPVFEVKQDVVQNLDCQVTVMGPLKDVIEPVYYELSMGVSDTDSGCILSLVAVLEHLSYSDPSHLAIITVKYLFGSDLAFSLCK